MSSGVLLIKNEWKCVAVDLNRSRTLVQQQQQKRRTKQITKRRCGTAKRRRRRRCREEVKRLLFYNLFWWIINEVNYTRTHMWIIWCRYQPTDHYVPHTRCHLVHCMAFHACANTRVAHWWGCWVYTWWCTRTAAKTRTVRVFSVSEPLLATNQYFELVSQHARARVCVFVKSFRKYHF